MEGNCGREIEKLVLSWLFLGNYAKMYFKASCNRAQQRFLASLVRFHMKLFEKLLIRSKTPIFSKGKKKRKGTCEEGISWKPVQAACKYIVQPGCVLAEGGFMSPRGSINITLWLTRWLLRRCGDAAVAQLFPHAPSLSSAPSSSQSGRDELQRA